MTQLFGPEGGARNSFGEARPSPESRPNSTHSPALTHIAREVAGDHSVAVRVGPAGGGSYADLEARTITLDGKDIEQLGRFLAAHEGAHLKDTASFEQLGVAGKELARKLGLLALKNVVEDCSINDRFVRDYPALDPDTRAAYPRKGESVGFIMHPEVQAQAQALGFIPRYAAGLAALLQDWSELRHELGFNRPDREYGKKPYMGPPIDDPEVEAFVKKILPDFREAVALKYKEGASGEEMLLAAKERHIWCEKVLYPALEELVKADLKQLAEEGTPGSESQGKRGTGEEEEQSETGKGSEGNEPEDNGAGSSKQENSDGKSGAGSSGDSPSAGEEESEGESGDRSSEGRASSGAGEMNGAGSSKQENSEGKSGAGSSADDRLAGEDAAETREHQPGAPGKGQRDPRREKRPESAQEKGDGGAERRAAANEEFKKLPQAERERLAREALAGFDDAVRESLKSLFDKQDAAPKAVEEVQAENDAEREAEAEAAAQADFQRGAKGLRDAILRELSPYQRYYHEVADRVNEIEGRVKDAFIPMMHFRWERGQPSGPKITMTEAMRFDATGEGAGTLFERRIDPTRPDIGVVVLVDRSGSMDGPNIEHAVKAAIFTKEIFQRIGVRCAIVGFSDEQEILASFDDDTAETTVQGAIMRGLTVGGGTQDAAALKFGAGLLGAERMKRGAIVVISDAQSGEGEALKPLVRAVEESGVPVLHFGIGDDTADNGGLYTRSFGELQPTTRGEKNFFDVFAREMEKLAQELF